MRLASKLSAIAVLIAGALSAPAPAISQGIGYLGGPVTAGGNCYLNVACTWTGNQTFPLINLTAPGSTGDISAMSIKPTGATTALTMAAIAAQTLLPQAYGASANTHYSLINGSYVAATAGSPIITAYSNTFTSADVGKNIVVSGLGPDVTQSAAIAAGGTGNAVGDVLTLSMPGCTTATKLTVTAVASGAIEAAVPTTNGSCAPASIPTNPVSVSSTTGSGSGATFTLTYGAYSLATTIAGVTSATQITLAVNSSQTVGHNETVAYGSDDSVAINAALASGLTSLTLNPSKTYGITAPIVFSTTNRIRFDCNGATIVALGPMAEMLYEAQPSNFDATQGSSVEGCRLEGMGQATLHVSQNAYAWTYRNNYYYNAAPGGGNLYIAGSGENDYFYGNRYDNELSVSGAYPLYIISDNYSDNQFTNEIGDGGVNGVVENSAGAYYTAVHIYSTLASQFVINGNENFLTSIFADSITSYTPGIELIGGGEFLQGWYAQGLVGATNPIGVYLPTALGYNNVSNGIFNNVTSANAIVTGYSAATFTNNQVFGNSTASYNYLSLPLGTLQQDYDTYAPAAGYIAQGSISTPITTNGGTFSITRFENLPGGACGGNPNDTECNAGLNVIVNAGTTDVQVLSGINVHAEGDSTVSTANIQALNCIGRVNGSGVGIAGCGYMEGRRNTSTGLAQGFEVTSWNNTNTTCFVNYGVAGVSGGLGACDGEWISARGLSSSYIESSALHIGLGNSTGQWAEGVTINKGAVASIGFDDQSSDTYAFVAGGSGTHTDAFADNSASSYSYEIGGTHTYGLVTFSATLASLISAQTSNFSGSFIDAHSATITGALISGPSSQMSGDGRVLLGTNGFPSIGNISSASEFQAYSANDNGAAVVVGQFTADTNSAVAEFYKSRATTIGSHAAIASGDTIFLINGLGDDGANAIGAASIQAYAMGTVSTGIVPGKLVLRTANTSGTLTQGLVLDDAQSGYVGSSGTTELFDASGDLYGHGNKGVTCTGALTAVTSITITGGVITAATGTGGTCS